jgi:hypothetical protein
MRLVALFCLVPLLMSAQVAGGRGVTKNGNPAGQPAAPPPPPTPPQDLCTIEGQVFNAATGQPLRKANISMNMSNMGPNMPPGQRNFSGSTDATGHFLIQKIEPGTYRVSADHTGFLNMQYNARRPNGPGTALDLARGQKMTGLVFRLTPHGVVSGRIVDEDGDPIEGVQIQVMRLVYNQGRKQLQINDNGNTNDLGEYRVAGVAPGKYYLCAIYRGGRRFVMIDNMAMNVGGAPDAPAPEQQDYAPTFYPNATDISAASTLEMKPGQQLTDMNFRLTKIHTVHVRGRVVNNATQSSSTGPTPMRVSGVPGDNQAAVNAAQEALQVAVERLQVAVGANQGPGINVTVRMQPRNELNPQGMNVNSRMKPDGTFDFPSVPPGSYNLIAQTNGGNRGHFVRMPVNVGTSNIEGLVVTINPGVSIVGHVKLDGDAPDAPQAFNIRLAPRDPGAGVGQPQPGKTGADGNFRLDDVNPDRYTVNINPMPGNLYLKSIRAGNIDVMADGLDLSNGSAPALDVVIGTTPASIAGAVQNESNGQPAVAVQVVLVPQEPERKGQGTYYRTATSDQYGKFSFTKILPGEYRAYAFEDVENGAWFDPDFMKPIASKGDSVSVREGAPSTLSLTMIPAGK